MSRQEPRVFIIAGEPSGDNLAGRLIGALREMTDNRVNISGIGGPQCEAQGLESLFPMRELALIGIAEVVPHLPRILKRMNQTADKIRETKPDLVVTVDAPSFTLRVAKKLRRLWHSHRALRGATSLGLARRSSQDVGTTRRPSDGLAALRGRLLCQAWAAYHLCGTPRD